MKLVARTPRVQQIHDPRTGGRRRLDLVVIQAAREALATSIETRSGILVNTLAT